MKNVSLTLFLLLTLMGCKDPAQVYFEQIAKLDFVPFQLPIAGVKTGTLFRGPANTPAMVAPGGRCFPDFVDGKPTHLRTTNDVTVPSTYQNVKVDFNAKLNSIVATGTPAFVFNVSMSKARKVELEIDSARIERLEPLELRDYYRHGMKGDCRELVLKYPFVMNELEVTRMSFVFLDTFGGKIAISSANVGDFVTFDVNVQWHIENGYKLVVTSPKVIGYQLARLLPEDDGFVHELATKIQKGEYVWRELGAFWE